MNVDRGRVSLRCWDMNDNAAIWWVIKGPVLASIMVSYSRIRGRMALQMSFLFNQFCRILTTFPVRLIKIFSLF